MHTEGVAECAGSGEHDSWVVRFECRGCGLRVGVEAPTAEAEALVDRIMWTDDARHGLERIPPYAAGLVRDQVESYARRRQRPVITYEVYLQAKVGESIEWDAEAEQRLNRVPAPVRTMARIELERTAADRGQTTVTVALMEEVKARYFGLASQK